jgi:N-methylhydantoinase B/oxoprolinase/acetone carboxylase alpha subunit
MGKGDRIRIETPGGGGWGVASEKYGLEGDTTEFVSGWAARGSLAERSAAQAEF